MIELITILAGLCIGILVRRFVTYHLFLFPALRCLEL